MTVIIFVLWVLFMVWMGLKDTEDVFKHKRSSLFPTIPAPPLPWLAAFGALAMIALFVAIASTA